MAWTDPGQTSRGASAPGRHATPWVDEAERAEAAWFADLVSADAALAQTVEGLLPGLRRRALARTLLALGRVGFLPDTPRRGDFRCAFPGGHCTLVCEGFSASQVLLRADLRALRVEWGNDEGAGDAGDATAGPVVEPVADPDGADAGAAAEAPRKHASRAVETVETPARLLEVVAANRDDDPEAWRRLALEITDSLLNEALALAAHRRTDARLPRGVRSGAPPELVRAALELDGSSAGALFFDQWAATGHPLHTVPKARIGLPPSAAMVICPEFHPRVPVRLAAVRRERVSAELPAGVASLEEWFAANFPAWSEEWRGRLEERGLDPSGYAPIPVHPWQAENVLPALLGDRTQDATVVLDGPELPMLPCLSVRSMVPEVPGRPGFKLALGLRLTSGVRTITPRSCHMGPRVSRLLRGIFEQDEGFGGWADLLDEPLGGHVRGGDGEHGEAIGKHFSFLARDPVSARLQEGQIAVPVAALAEPIPDDGTPLLLRLLAGVGAGAADGRAGFEHYAERFLAVVLRSYLVYGIALEAHGQNVLACFDRDGRLVKFLQRDLAGIRIHEPTLERLGLALEVHPDRRTVVRHFDDHRFWLRHRAYHAHLGHIAHGIALATGECEARLWRSAGDVTAALFDRLKDESVPALWASERHALLAGPWIGKDSLRMRLSNQVRDLAFSAPNPFRLSSLA